MISAKVNAQAFDVDKCIEKGNFSDEAQTKCYTEDTKYIVAKIEAKYQAYIKDPFYATYHDGNARTEESIKKTLNAWKLYLKNYCNLAAYSYKEEGRDAMDSAKAECLRGLAIQQLDLVNALEERGFGTRI